MPVGSTLRILQHNVRKSYPVMLELFAEESTLQCDIIAIQEPWRNNQYNSTYNSAPDRFELLYYDKKTTRTCFYVNKDIALSSWNVTHHTTDYSTLKLKTSDARTINVHNLYNPGVLATGANRSVMQLKKRLEGSPHEEHIALEDFNLHHAAWGGVDVPREDRASEILIEIAETHGMEQLLAPGTVTYSDKGSSSTIDLVYATSLLAESRISCRTMPDLHSSDHYPIETTFNLRTIEQPTAEKRRFRKTNTALLRDHMKQELDRMPRNHLRNEEEVDEFVTYITTAIQRSIEVSTPTIHICKYSMPGFDEECKEAVMEANRLHRRHQSTRSQEDWEDYVIARNWKKTLITKMKRRAYRESREKACESPIAMWKASKSARRSGPPPQACIPSIRKEDGSLEDNSMNKLKILKKSFFPPQPTVQLEDTINYQYPTPHYTGQITDDEIYNAIMRPGPYKAPGISGIPNVILQRLVHQLTPALSRLFNKCYNIGYCPQAFRNSITIVLKKPESGNPEEPRDYHEAKSYRPIALLETLGKALESIIARKMTYIAEKHGLLPEGHMGGRRCRSTEHAIHALVEKIITAWNKGKIVSALFLDVSGAFDNVSHARLIHNLKKRRVDHRVGRWVESFFKDRTTTIKSNEACMENVNINTGIPQGSPLSPILYLFYNADLMEIGKKHKCMLATGFIDDTMYAAEGRSAAANNEVLTKAHKEAMEWTKKHGSKFAIKKYQLTHFSWRRSNEWKLDLQLGDQTVKATSHSKFLGAIMDRKLMWREHVNQLKMKATKSLTGLSKLAGSTWGGSLLTIRRIYEAVVVPQMTYGCSVWYTPIGETNHKRWMLEDLQVIQARALRIVTGAFRATARAALDVEAYMLPIKQRLEKLTNDTMLRIVATPSYKYAIGRRSKAQNRRTTPLETLTARFRRHTGIRARDIEKVEPFVEAPWWKPPSILISEDKKKGKVEHDVTRFNRKHNHQIIYTDGSNINQKVGAAAVDIDNRIILKSFLGKALHYTVYSAELRGINLALLLALRQKVQTKTTREVTVFTDNQAAIRSLANPSERPGLATVRDIIKKIEQLRSLQIVVNLQWIPAHIGIEGNERADVAAKEATGWRMVVKRNGKPYEKDTNKTAPQAIPSIEIARPAVNMHVKKEIKRMWSQDWENETRGRSLYKVMKTPSNSVLKIHRGLRKWISSVLVQMRTQKIGLAHFLHYRRVPGYNTAECECEGNYQTVMHVLMECPLHYRLRRETWKEESKKPERRALLNTFQSLLTDTHFARKAAIF